VGGNVSIETGLFNEKKEFFMVQGISVVIYPVTDLAQAKTLYSTEVAVEPSNRGKLTRGNCGQIDSDNDHNEEGC
jgi:hypothetical protein